MLSRLQFSPCLADAMCMKGVGLLAPAVWLAMGRLMPAYSWTRLDLNLDQTSGDTSSVYTKRENPQRQIQIRSNLDVSRRIQFDAAAYYVSSLPYLAVDAYTRLDARLGYKLRSGLELSLIGQNLQGGKHAEFVTEGPYTRAAIARSYFARLTWGF